MAGYANQQGWGMEPRGRGGFGERGRGRGAGQGWRNRFGGAAGQPGQQQSGFAPWSGAGTGSPPSAADSGPQQEKAMLKQQMAQLEQALNEVKQRMESFETGSGNQDG
jgi:hypothetical protein